MSETALYRKYRPEAFADLIGQEHIVAVLEGALKQDKLAHAYLFSGSRGTGKTTSARIVARALGTAPSDLYEIDAASNRGIDNIRELRENVSTMPFDFTTLTHFQAKKSSSRSCLVGFCFVTACARF